MLIYGRADGMPSSHVSVVVRASTASLQINIPPSGPTLQQDLAQQSVFRHVHASGATLPSEGRREKGREELIEH